MTIPKLEEVCDNAPFHKDNDGGGSTRELYGERIGSYVGTIKREYYNLIKAAPKLYAALRDLHAKYQLILDFETAPDHIKTSIAVATKEAETALAEAAGLEVQ